MNTSKARSIIEREVGLWAYVPSLRWRGMIIIPGLDLKLWDREYIPVKSEDVKALFTLLDLPGYIPETQDCDDFADIAKGRVAESDMGNAFWKAGNGMHSFNVFITPEGKLMVLEPQTGEIDEYAEISNLEKMYRLGRNSTIV